MLNTRLEITATRTGWIMLMRLKVLKIFSYLRVTPPWLTLSWCWQKFSSHFKHEFVIMSCIELHSSWESQCCCLVDAEFRISFHPHMTIHTCFLESIYVLHSYSWHLFEMSVNGSKRGWLVMDSLAGEVIKDLIESDECEPEPSAEHWPQWSHIHRMRVHQSINELNRNIFSNKF